jgi:hypothetical protein
MATDRLKIAQSLSIEYQLKKLSSEVDKLINISAQHGMKIKELTLAASSSVSQVEFMSAITTTRFQALHVAKQMASTKDHEVIIEKTIDEPKENPDIKSIRAQIQTIENQQFNNAFKNQMEMKKLENEVKISHKQFFEMKNYIAQLERNLDKLVDKITDAGIDTDIKFSDKNNQNKLAEEALKRRSSVMSNEIEVAELSEAGVSIPAGNEKSDEFPVQAIDLIPDLGNPTSQVADRLEVAYSTPNRSIFPAKANKEVSNEFKSTPLIQHGESREMSRSILIQNAKVEIPSTTFNSTNHSEDPISRTLNHGNNSISDGKPNLDTSNERPANQITDSPKPKKQFSQETYFKKQVIREVSQRLALSKQVETLASALCQSSVEEVMNQFKAISLEKKKDRELDEEFKLFSEAQRKKVSTFSQTEDLLTTHDNNRLHEKSSLKPTKENQDLPAMEDDIFGAPSPQKKEVMVSKRILPQKRDVRKSSIDRDMDDLLSFDLNSQEDESPVRYDRVKLDGIKEFGLQDRSGHDADGVEGGGSMFSENTSIIEKISLLEPINLDDFSIAQSPSEGYLIKATVIPSQQARDGREFSSATPQTAEVDPVNGDHDQNTHQPILNLPTNLPASRQSTSIEKVKIAPEVEQRDDLKLRFQRLCDKINERFVIIDKHSVNAAHKINSLITRIEKLADSNSKSTVLQKKLVNACKGLYEQISEIENVNSELLQPFQALINQQHEKTMELESLLILQGKRFDTKQKQLEVVISQQASKVASNVSDSIVCLIEGLTLLLSFRTRLRGK